jgi:hypothetical protein
VWNVIMRALLLRCLVCTLRAQDLNDAGKQCYVATNLHFLPPPNDVDSTLRLKPVTDNVIVKLVRVRCDDVDVACC